MRFFSADIIAYNFSGSVQSNLITMLDSVTNATFFIVYFELDTVNLFFSYAEIEYILRKMMNFKLASKTPFLIH